MDRIEVNVLTKEIKQMPLTEGELADAQEKKTAWDIVEAERLVKEAARQERAQEIIDNLPSWQDIDDVIDNATTVPALKGIVRKLARVVYIMARLT